MRAAAAHVGQVEHQVTWARTTCLPASTLSRWTDLLEISYQLARVPAFGVNRSKRLARNGSRQAEKLDAVNRYPNTSSTARRKLGGSMAGNRYSSGSIRA